MSGFVYDTIYGVVTLVALWAAAYYSGRNKETVDDASRLLYYTYAIFWPAIVSFYVVYRLITWPYLLGTLQNEKKNPKTLTQQEIELLEQEGIE